MKKAWSGLGYGESAMQSARRKLQSCQFALSGWSSTKFRNSAKILTAKTKQLEGLQNRADPNSKELIKLLQGEINHLLEREDIK